MINNNNKSPIIIHYNDDDIANIYYKNLYTFLNKDDSYLPIYEECLLVDFINYYLRNTYKDIICIYNRMDQEHETIRPEFTMLFIKNDFIENIIDKQNIIKRQYIGALIYNIFIPYIFSLKKLNNININNINGVYIYSEMKNIMYWLNYCDFSNNYYNMNTSYNTHIKEILRKNNHTFNYHNPDEYSLFNVNHLSGIFCDAFFDIVSNLEKILSCSKVILLKFINNNDIYFVNNDIIKFHDIDKYIINNKFFEYIVEKEYFVKQENKNNDYEKDHHLNNNSYKYNDYSLLNFQGYLDLYCSINKNDLLKYNNIIKPWAQENIYPNINDIYEYRYCGICKPFDIYQPIGSTFIKNKYKAYIDIIPNIKYIVDYKMNKALNDYLTIKRFHNLYA